MGPLAGAADAPGAAVAAGAVSGAVADSAAGPGAGADSSRSVRASAPAQARCGESLSTCKVSARPLISARGEVNTVPTPRRQQVQEASSSC